MSRESLFISENDIASQKQYINDINTHFSGRLTYHIVTLGCQMNVRDSETLSGMMRDMGFAQAEKEQADIVLYNTCCVRENAENRALGNVIWLKELKKNHPDMIIGVCGCMMQEKGVAEHLHAQYPFIDLIFGTHNAYRFPEYLHRILFERCRVADVVASDGIIAEDLPVMRSEKHSAFVNIMYGCNNFCSYCIVPYVRGRERSRRVEDILSEVRSLKDAGVMEITLLGQNVNSYNGGGSEFANLLRRISDVGIPRIRFMTSHPKDLSDDLIAAMRDVPNVMPQLHLPVQAGNSEILRRMNRRYTREHYLDLVNRLRDAVPEIGLTTDIIVGFPGETLEQFEDTMSLVEKVRYDSAYTFIFSLRRGTAAASYPDDTPADEKSRRIQRLIDLQQNISQEILDAQVGKKEIVLVDGQSTRDAGYICGRTPRGHMVNFPGNVELLGKLVPVQILSAGRNTLKGEIIHA
ncbi:MAG: tRNA (N6-isopentenyl adenosine(37)-C2)-methylthiotransferase MiaB [Clostridiales bacterium]|nr:tRNA (N6-isopentenyl adenosine(37)-C2)-methylthiotransferase MiaB [Clostridiales bacterium]